MIHKTMNIVFVFIITVMLILASGCTSSTQPTPIPLTIEGLDPGYLNQRIAVEGTMWSTDTIKCQTIVWITDRKEEYRCTGVSLKGDYPFSVHLALRTRLKSGLYINYGTGGQIFSTFQDLKAFDSEGKDQLDRDRTVRVTGTLYWPEDSYPIIVVDTIELVE
jgi:hypothetical protein